MDKIYFYSNGVKFHQRTRHSLEKFDKILIGFFDKYTNTIFNKIKLTYNPRRISDQEEYTNWLNNNQDIIKLPPLEKENEVEETFKYLEKLNILGVEHFFKGDTRMRNKLHYEEHIYDIHSDSYNELLNLLKYKSGTCFSNLTMLININFNFKNVDYDEFKNIFNWYKKSESANSINVWISNDYYKSEKPDHSLDFNLHFPIFSENEKNFLRIIQKELKVNFSPRHFYYYYKTKKGTFNYKKERIEL